MKIAVVSDDHKTISMHFGRAEFYEVYTIEAGKVTEHETLSRSFPLNPTAAVVQPGQEAAHGHHHDHNAMIAPISDCLALIARGMGRGAHDSLQENDIQPIISDLADIQSALDAYIAGTLTNHPEKLH